MQNRIYKFRGWDYGLKQMSYSNLHSIGFDGVLHYGNAEFGRYPMIIMQFTGLLDKNGKEIYEGDVIRHESGSGKVVWTESDACWSVEKNEDWTYPFSCNVYKGTHEVIGNIYENPELIK